MRVAATRLLRPFRILRRQPLFSLLGIWTIAIGIGASAAVFAPFNALLLRPLPFEGSRDLVQLSATNPAQGVASAGMAWGDFVDVRSESRSLESAAAFRAITATITGGERPEVVQVALVTSGLFELLRTNPQLGRGFAPGDEVRGQEAVVVLADGFWRRRFGSRDVVGRDIEIEGEQHEVIGVMPPGFGFPSDDMHLWAPLALPLDPPDRLSHYLSTVGRLAPGADVETASRELSGLAARLENEYPESNEGWGIEVLPLQESLVARFRPALKVLGLAVGLLMLITCVNVASLLLARGAERRAECALRSALGSTRRALLGQALSEAVVLSLVGGALGLLLGSLFIRLVLAEHRELVPLVRDVGIDGSVLAFAALLALLTGILSGLVPALQLSTRDLRNALGEQGGTVSEGRRGRRWRASLLVAETALAILLLIGAGLMLRSFLKLQAVELGFEPERAVALEVSLAGSRYPTDAAMNGFAEAVRDRLERSPAVTAAAVGSSIPLHGRGQNVLPFRVAGVEERLTEGRYIAFSAVGPGYFEALGVRLSAGRPIEERDRAGAPGVAIVNRTASRNLFPRGEALDGTIFLTPRGTEPVPYRVVGIIEDHLQRSLGETPQPAVYVPYSQVPHGNLHLVVRHRGRTDEIVELAQRTVLAVDPDQPVAQVLPLSDVVREAGARSRMYTRMFLVFGALGLLLASSGIYGVIAHQTAKRHRELGIRLALGADGRGLLARMVRESLGWALLGAVVGVTAAFLLSRFVSSLLFGVDQHDPIVFVAVPALLLVVAALATLFGGRRVLAVQPSSVLRDA